MSPIKMSKIESGSRTVLAFNQAFNRHDIDGMMKMLSDTCIFEDAHPAPEGTIFKGKSAIRQHWQTFFRNTPGVQKSIEDLIGLGRHCIMRWRYENGEDVEGKGHLRGADIYRVEDGVITEINSYAKA